MVKLTEKTRKSIEEAVATAERSTHAEIAVAVAQASDPYHFITLAYGLGVGTVIAATAWLGGITHLIAWVFGAQLATITAFMLIAPLRRACLHFAPKRLLHYRASSRAAVEYVRLTYSLPSQKPVVLLYISLAEHYVHIHASGAVLAVIAVKEWDGIVATLTREIGTDGFEKAVTKCVQNADEMLKAKFPSGSPHTELPNVIELK